MATSREHYDRHLGPIYTWMLGDFDVACRAAAEELTIVGLLPSEGELVVDLGCGSGQFSIVLAQSGASVVAIDCCSSMLAELKQRASGLDVRTVQSDVRSFRDYVKRPVSGIICMGDTLTHLSSEADVQALLREVAAALQVGGVFITTFRDYTRDGPIGEARFIPVRSDADRILTCFIDYGQSCINVTDLIHERDGESWRLRTSSYEKIKLAPQTIAAILEDCSCDVRIENGSLGMVRIVAVR